MLHSFKYSFLEIFRNREMIFFSIAFPIILASLFGFVIAELNVDSSFESIPVAITQETEDTQISEGFLAMMNELSQGDEAILQLQTLTLDAAMEKLQADEILGIYRITEDGVSLTVAGTGIRQSVLQMISNRFLQIQSTLNTIGSENPELIPGAVASIMQEININQEAYVGRAPVDPLAYSVLAFLAMSCFMGSSSGLRKVFQIQANRSPLAARRGLSSKKRISMIIPDFLAAMTAQFIYSSIALVYFIFVLGMDFGNNIPLMLLAMLAGSAVGTSLGIFFGATIQRGTEKSLDGLLTGITMLLYVAAGMMTIAIRVLIRENVMILDRLNPVSHLIDAFYALGSFSDYRHFTTSILTMFAFTVFFCVASAIILRRKSYDSI